MRRLAIGLCAVICGLSSCVSAKENVKNESAYQDYLVWLDNLKSEMLKKGIRQETLDKVYGENDFYHEKPQAVLHDRKQPEFVFTSADYLNRLVCKERAEQAAVKYKENKALLQKVAQQYALPAEYLIAFWGAETNFGTTFGGYNVFDALTEMSYDKRRAKFFTNELYNALKILQEQKFEPAKMQSSWAGAMGNFQFMPTTYNKYAVDFNANGKIDIWDEFDDAAASAANYLTAIGWEKDIPWGWQVELPWNFDYALSGRDKKQSIAFWKQKGVQPKDGWGKIKDDVLSAVVTPEGARGEAYLVTDNFHKIMQWNRSENYALAIGLLADYAKGKKAWRKIKHNSEHKLKSDDVKKVQQFINQRGLAKLDEDGTLGSKTKEAIKVLQKEAMLPQDGYPSAVLLDKIANYNPQTGFTVPIPERKLHKPK